MDLVRARKKCDSVPLQCAYTCLSPNFFSSVPSLPRHEPIIVISSILKEFDSIPGITEVFSSRIFFYPSLSTQFDVTWISFLDFHTRLSIQHDVLLFYDYPNDQ